MNQDRDLLLEYIMKLNDRKLNKKMASGFTLWALLGFLGLLSYKILNQLPLIIDNYRLISVLFINAFNFMIIIFTIFNYLTIYTLMDEERKLLPNLFSKSAIPIKIIHYLTLIIGGTINFIIALNKKIIFAIPYYFFTFYIIVILLTLFLSINRKAKMVKQGHPTVQHPFLNETLKKYAKYFAVIHIFMLSLFFYFSLSQVINKEFLLNNIEIIKISFHFIIVVGVANILAYKYSNYIKNDWLESFERKVILNDYKYKQIKSEFMKEYLGTPTQLWLKKLESEIDERKENLKKAFDEFEDNYRGIDANKDVENIKERFNNNTHYYNKLNEKHERFQATLDNKIKLIKSFISQGPFPKKEVFILDNIRDKWLGYINYFQQKLEVQYNKMKSDKDYIEKIVDDKSDLLEIDMDDNHDFT